MPIMARLVVGSSQYDIVVALQLWFTRCELSETFRQEGE